MEANPLGELLLPGMNDAREKRVEQLPFMLMMHTKNRAIQMITRLSDPVNGLEIWRRFLEEWEPVNRGRYRAMLMQLLQCPLTESRGQALEECERPVRQYEAQNLDTLRDTFKAATLRRGCRGMMLPIVFGKRKAKTSTKAKTRASTNAKAKACAQAKRKASVKAKRKEKARISRRKEHQTRRTRNAPFAKERIVPSPWNGHLRRKQ